MKTTALAAVLLLAGASTPALADAHVEKSEAKAETLTVDSPIEKLMANAKTAAILEKHFPGIGSHPAFDQFKSMSLVQVQPWSGGLVTDEKIAAVKADLAKLG
ncbi:MAG: hypothetical protein SXU28_14880 [Pseudomonadota bacterium]|nr:hypothetical protein [Pseudomonadota bacterium]